MARDQLTRDENKSMENTVEKKTTKCDLKIKNSDLVLIYPETYYRIYHTRKDKKKKEKNQKRLSPCPDMLQTGGVKSACLPIGICGMVLTKVIKEKTEKKKKKEMVETCV